MVTTVQYASTVCGKCRNAGKQSLGEAKITVVIPGQAVDPKAVCDEQLYLLHQQQLQLRDMQAQGGEYRADLAKELRELSRCIADVLKEWRQLERDAREASAQLNAKERRAVIIDWVCSLLFFERKEVVIEIAQEMSPDERDELVLAIGAIQ